jgi:hypothetical protein
MLRKSLPNIILIVKVIFLPGYAAYLRKKLRFSGLVALIFRGCAAAYFTVGTAA